jgi:hypothetical protein
MTNKLRDELEIVLNPYFEPLVNNAHKQRQMAAVNDIIDHLAPTMRQVVGALKSCDVGADFNFNPPRAFQLHDENKINKVLASLSAWQEKAE